MLSAVTWVPRGAAKAVPQVAEPTPEELELMKEEAEREGGEGGEEEEEEEEEEEWEEVREGEEEEGGGEGMEVVEEPLDKGKKAKVGKKAKKGSRNAADVEKALAELDMDKYDEEDECAINLFGTGKGVGGAYYRSNEDDPFLVEGDDEDEDEIDDLTIRQSDLLLLAARNEDDVSFIELWVCEEPEAGEEDYNMYVHHDIMLPAFPLAMAWMDFNVKTPLGGASPAALGPSTSAGTSTNQGSFVAVGTMNPGIEIWDLDMLDEVEPAASLGGFVQGSKASKAKSKSKGKKQAKGVKGTLKEDSHQGAVMCLSWNQEFRNVLASGGEDECVKVWDMASQQCQYTLSHHSGKVQSVAWCPLQPSVLLSGSFDKTVALVDGRAPADPCRKWTLTADVEATLWDPHQEHRFLVSSEDGLVCAFDSRAGGGDNKVLFTLSAHDKATCTMSFNPKVPHLLATGSTDKKVKLWDISSDSPRNLASHNPRAGAVFSVAFCGDSPSILAMGGSKGSVHLWNVSQLKAVSPLFGH